MKNIEITNQNLFHIDWAAADRQKFLQSIPVGRVQKNKQIAPGIMCKGVLMQDVSGNDGRSVKAMLRGRGDLRACWWNVFNVAAIVLNPCGTLESRMYAFHRMHHFVTVTRLEFLNNLGEIAWAVKTKALKLKRSVS
ncbi:hypothetical protein SAMN04515620_17211 [Collimonas sp. OK607]|uniref:hypothetical protein n=1 Tax=Collimonas sp. OK607 TaxID=1798194 RepID=UPI0008F249DC|nr:hypothetical protein [Collimonas sp. OK607]SFB41249.1 hypothetical protein SAMN04515620_17211 [Collimonas sp. OK607]